MNKDYPNCDKCVFMVEYIIGSKPVKFCEMWQSVFGYKELVLLENNVGCEMFEEVDEN